MDQLEVTWPRALKVWWSITWRITVFGLLVSLAAGMPIAGIAMVAGLGMVQTEILVQAITLPLWALVGIWVVYRVLKLEYADFRIALVPSSEARLAQRFEGHSDEPT